MRIVNGDETSVRLGARWSRAAVINVVGVLLIAAFATQMYYGRVMGLGGTSIVLQNTPAQFSTARLHTTNVGFAMVPVKVGSRTNNSTKYVLRFGFASGALDGFCISQSKSVLGVDYTLRLSARDGALDTTSTTTDPTYAAPGNYDVVGSNVQFDVTSTYSSGAPNTGGNGIQLSGNVAMGQSTQSITTWQSGGVDVVNPLDGPAYGSGIGGRLWGVDSDRGDLYNLKGDIYNAYIQGPINIKNLKIEVVKGSGSTQGCKNLPIVY